MKENLDLDYCRRNATLENMKRNRIVYLLKIDCDVFKNYIAGVFSSKEKVYEFITELSRPDSPMTFLPQSTHFNIQAIVMDRNPNLDSNQKSIKQLKRAIFTEVTGNNNDYAEVAKRQTLRT